MQAWSGLPEIEIQGNRRVRENHRMDRSGGNQEKQSARTGRYLVGTSTPDRIEMKVLLRAPVSRVWSALSDAREFGTWFGVDFSGGTFAPGARMRGKVLHPGYEHLTMDLTIDRMEPERLLSWRWHPHAIDPKVDYSTEPTTHVVFELTGGEGGTMLTVAESGFDRIPISSRAEAYKENEQGWEQQIREIERYLRKAA
jgi:uncharacterized protein YndB with AHSA1/START domain